MMSERLASVSRSSRQTLGEDDMEVPVRTTASRLLTRRNATVSGLRACLPSDESRSDVTVLARRLGAPVGELRARLLADRPPARPARQHGPLAPEAALTARGRVRPRVYTGSPTGYLQRAPAGV